MLEATRLRLVKRFGNLLDQWWIGLPATLSSLTERWSLELKDPVGRGNTSLVIRCNRGDGTPAVLKLVPDHRIAATEGHALLAWRASRRVPRVFELDIDAGALLMEAVPGETTLEDGASPDFLQDVTNLIRDLHESAAPESGHDFDSLNMRVDFMFRRCAERLAGTANAAQVISPAAIESSHRLAAALALNPPKSVLLHGDLHAGNILNGGSRRGLVAIDPRPCVGDAVFDAIDYVFWPEASPSQWLCRRDQLAKLLGCDETRLWDWCRSVCTVFAVGKVARGGTRDDIASLMKIAQSSDW